MELKMDSKNLKDKLDISLISDSTGETALAVLKAVLIQYIHENQVHVSRYKDIKTKEQIENIFKKISTQKDKTCLVVYTLIMPDSRNLVKKLCEKYQVQGVDILSKLINIFDTNLINKEKQVGVLRTVNEDYFKRIEAMDFFLKHDDGQLPEYLNSADIILIGVSRTSKTPLSLFLSNKGWKVANIPLVSNISPPNNLFKADQKKIVALTIDPDYLLKIRKNRLEKFGYDPGASYADKDNVYLEVLEMQALFQKHRWPVIDVTERALEETAGEIVRIVSARMKLPVKII